jgi:hypothetical protein
MLVALPSVKDDPRFAVALVPGRSRKIVNPNLAKRRFRTHHVPQGLDRARVGEQLLELGERTGLSRRPRLIHEIQGGLLHTQNEKG